MLLLGQSNLMSVEKKQNFQKFIIIIIIIMTSKKKIKIKMSVVVCVDLSSFAVPLVLSWGTFGFTFSLR